MVYRKMLTVGQFFLLKTCTILESLEKQENIKNSIAEFQFFFY